MTEINNSTSSNYLQDHLPPDLIQKLEAGAFESLLQHLQDRSDAVQNIDLMTVSGFCRNCLAKWMVVEARKLSETLPASSEVKQALDALGYDEAAQYVYGMEYPSWKKKHATKASEEQMKLFEDSKPLWATHDKQLLAKRAESAPTVNNTTAAATSNTQPATSFSSLLSNVCCQPMDEINAAPAQQSQQPQQLSTPPSLALPTFLSSFSLAILTVSDRASKGDYQDLSGPAVQQAVQDVLQGSTVTLSKITTAVVPDDMPQIQQQLQQWADSQFDLILTTGGTGMAPRDVTPEATEAIVEQKCPGLMQYCSMLSTLQQPLAALSRGTAGILQSTLIVNLPGNPKAVHELVPLVLPLALHAVADMEQSSSSG